jgi:putative transcriptional regulator
MKEAHFNELLAGVRELAATLNGDKKYIAKIDRISPDSVGAIRAKIGMSQSRFAKLLGISMDTLQNWEQGRRKPSGPASVLLKIAARHPDIVLEATG